MKNPSTTSLNFVSPMAVLIGLVACSLPNPSNVKAIQDPPGCSGANYQSGFDFALAQAHVGDIVPVVPRFGVVMEACRMINVTGSIYIATGKLTNFLNNATLDPGISVSGRYNILITSDLVGAGVSSPHGSISGVAMTVRALENVDGTALTGAFPETVGGGFHSTSISIVTPALGVVQQPAYPQGVTCFHGAANIQCTGYVTNAGDITLTNVTVIDNRVGRIQLLDPTSGQPFPANVILAPGEYARFANTFLPTPQERTAGSATSSITVTAQDTTEIGGPSSLVTTSTTTTNVIADNPAANLTDAALLADHKFGFNVTGQAGVKYAVQATMDIKSMNWVSLVTNTAPFNFVDDKAAQFPTRFYRAVSMP